MKQSIQRRAWTLLGAVLAALAVTGCNEKRTYPVEGSVVFKDGTAARELAGYVVDFKSDEKPVGATGVIGEDGTFTVGTHKGNDGAILGKHRVTLSPPLPIDDRPPPPPLIPARYREFDKSGLEVEIKPERNKVVLEVERLKR